MALNKYEFDDLGLDVEVEPLGAIFKFFKHGELMYFGQCVVTTGTLQQGVVKGLETRTDMSPTERKKLDKAIRRTLKKTNYTEAVYQRKKPNQNAHTIKKPV